MLTKNVPNHDSVFLTKLKFCGVCFCENKYTFQENYLKWELFPAKITIKMGKGFVDPAGNSYPNQMFSSINLLYIAYQLCKYTN